MANELLQDPSPDTTITQTMSVPIRCEACGGETHIETIGVKDYYFCNDITCNWFVEA
jgi:hypothetical protein